MKKYYSIPVILILFFLANISASFAQAGVATVDTRILLMLHPLMMDFDYSIGNMRRFMFNLDGRENQWIETRGNSIMLPDLDC